MQRLNTAPAVMVALMCFTSVYLVESDDSRRKSLPHYSTAIKTHHWRSVEDKAFAESGVCASENRSYVETCHSIETVFDLHDLRRAQCFCDIDCHKYGDCCLNFVSKRNTHAHSWKCRNVRGTVMLKIPIYVWQTCPREWADTHVRTMCEVEAVELEAKEQPFSYLQDIPVKSKTNGIFYRNVFCALCNREIELVEWDSFIYCPGVSGENNSLNASPFDFSRAVYNTRSQNFINVNIDGLKTNCRIVIRDFQLKALTHNHSARLCKSVISTCNEYADEESRQKCQSYTSFVYENGQLSHRRLVYKNFHCALCNSANVGKITCIDPLYPPVFTGSVNYTSGVSLSFLFDFNFGGDNNQLGVLSPCKLKDGFIWDNVLKTCSRFTCGALFERKGVTCVPRYRENQVGALNNTCLKRILLLDTFTLNQNGSVFIKRTGKLLSSTEYEINEKNGNEVISISVCVEEGSYLLHLSRVHYWLSEITLSLSIICLIFHLFVYSVLKDLRNCPGKILMSLSACLICGHIFLLTGQHIKDFYWMCYVCGALIHFGYLSSFLWMNVMAYDIYRTFSVTQCRNLKKKNTFVKYSLYCWTTAVGITTFSVVFDNVTSNDNEFRPKYGDPICWFNQRKGLLIFFILPIVALLLKNVMFFTITAFKIRRISKEAKLVKNFSEKERFLLHIKLTVVLGLTWLLGILAAILRVSFLWYPFILLNGLQGVFIFVAFTVKKKIIKMLLVKFKIHSDSYKMGKQSALKRAIYSSLSNLSTLQTNVISQLPTHNENNDLLKAVRKINPDSVLEEKIF